MSKNKNYLLILLLIISFISCHFIYNVKADSGWDTDYDSSSWDYDSSWDSDSSWSSSSWDYDSSSSSGSYYYSSGSGSDIEGFFSLILIILIYFAPILLIKELSKRRYHLHRKPILKEMNYDEIKRIDPNLDIEKFKKDAYDKFVTIQKAWMDFDYETLRDNLTDELYNTYKMDLEILSSKNQKNIMKDFKLISTAITSVTINNGVETVNIGLNVTFKDYVVDENNVTVRGLQSTVYNNEYLLSFVKKGDFSNNKCPKCGAKIEDKASTRCIYCGSTIISDNYDFVLSKKTKVYQKIVGR